jgi:hypothetical protein
MFLLLNARCREVARRRKGSRFRVESPEESDNLPDPYVWAQEIVKDRDTERDYSLTIKGALRIEGSA